MKPSRCCRRPLEIFLVMSVPKKNPPLKKKDVCSRTYHIINMPKQPLIEDVKGGSNTKKKSETSARQSYHHGRTLFKI